MLNYKLVQNELHKSFQDLGKEALHQPNLTPKAFAKKYWKLEHKFATRNTLDIFCYESDLLADKLFDNYKDNFVGIIMSTLCKINEFRPQALETFAWKGFDIAKINHDFVHMMARLNDLINVYSRDQYFFKRYIMVLYRQEKCLHTLTTYYEDLSKNYNTISRSIKPKETYQKMLGYTQIEIGKICKYTKPQEAYLKLLSAYNIFTELGQRKEIEYIKKLLNDIVTNNPKY